MKKHLMFAIAFSFAAMVAGCNKGGTTAPQDDTPDIPSDTTDIPSDTTDVPSDTTDVPSDTTDVPSDTTDIPQWSSYRDVSVNTTFSGANVAGGVTGFPLLIRLSSAHADVFLNAKPGGADLRFATAGVRRPYQIEHWDAAGQSAAIWVLADVPGNSDSVVLRMYWGNPAAEDSSNGSAVFSPANGFLAVWHLNEVPGAPAQDATGNGHTATPEGSPANVATGIGTGKSFSSSQGHAYAVADPNSLLSLNTNTGPYTISAWVNPVNACNGSGNGGRYTIISKYSTVAGANKQFALMTSGTTAGAWRFLNAPTNYGGSTSANEFYVDVSCAAGEWQYVAQTYYSPVAPPVTTAPPVGDQTYALNLFAYSMNPWTGLTGPVTNTSTNNYPGSQNTPGTESPVFIGKLASSDRYMNGALDEVVVSGVQRSPDWHRLSYETQRPGSAVVTLGPTGDPSSP